MKSPCKVENIVGDGVYRPDYFLVGCKRTEVSNVSGDFCCDQPYAPNYNGKITHHLQRRKIYFK